MNTILDNLQARIAEVMHQRYPNKYTPNATIETCETMCTENEAWICLLRFEGGGVICYRADIHEEDESMLVFHNQCQTHHVAGWSHIEVSIPDSVYDVPTIEEGLATEMKELVTKYGLPDVLDAMTNEMPADGWDNTIEGMGMCAADLRGDPADDDNYPDDGSTSAATHETLGDAQ